MIGAIRTFFIWILAFLMLGEVGLRLYGKGIEKTRPKYLMGRALIYEPALFARHVFPRKAQKLIPNQGEVSASGDIQYQINDKGYRGKDFAVEKEPGTIRIMVYGG